MIIYQWTLINRLLDDKMPHEIAYLWCRLSSLSTPADPSRSFIGGLFSTEFSLDRSFLRSPVPFLSSPIHPASHASSSVTYLFFSFLVCGPFPGKQRLREKAKTANHSPIADRDNGNKDMRGSNIRCGIFVGPL